MPDLSWSIALLLAGLVVILAGAGLFVNSIEWFGRRLDLGAGVVGSVFAALGTALPETLIPIIAILFVGGEESKEIGVGAILGAPFLLTTLVFAECGLAAWWYSRRTGRSPHIQPDVGVMSRDLKYFLAVYGTALALSLLPVGDWLRYTGAVFLLAYAWFVFRAVAQSTGHSGEELQPLHFAPKLPHPHLSTISVQLVVGLGLIVLGARIFVSETEQLAGFLGIAPLILALIIAPIASELPETFNSVLWIRQGKDTLAMSNVTGAMVFQSSVPVAVGVAFTDWNLSGPGLVSGLLAMSSAAIALLVLMSRKSLSTPAMIAGLLYYFVFFAYVLLNGK